MSERGSLPYAECCTVSVPFKRVLHLQGVQYVALRVNASIRYSPASHVLETVCAMEHTVQKYKASNLRSGDSVTGSNAHEIYCIKTPHLLTACNDCCLVKSRWAVKLMTSSMAADGGVKACQ